MIRLFCNIFLVYTYVTSFIQWLLYSFKCISQYRACLQDMGIHKFSKRIQKLHFYNGICTHKLGTKTFYFRSYRISHLIMLAWLVYNCLAESTRGYSHLLLKLVKGHTHIYWCAYWINNHLIAMVCSHVVCGILFPI